LRTITTANHYNTDAGLHVYDWLDRDLASSELDAIIYRDTGCRYTQASLTQYIHILRVEIALKTQQGSDTAKRLRTMLGDVYAALDVDETLADWREYRDD